MLTTQPTTALRSSRLESICYVSDAKPSGRAVSNAAVRAVLEPNGLGSDYCTAMVTLLEVTPPMVSTTGTALLVGDPAGTITFT
jgi:hypothetical protein